jgi:hypothetical protein
VRRPDPGKVNVRTWRLDWEVSLQAVQIVADSPRSGALPDANITEGLLTRYGVEWVAAAYLGITSSKLYPGEVDTCTLAGRGHGISARLNLVTVVYCWCSASLN